MKENILLDKTFAFSVRVVNAYKYLLKEHREFVLSKQFLRSGTSIGANAEEAIGAQSRNDFVSKLSIAYKEARETKYWIRILQTTGFFDRKQGASLMQDADELLRIIGKIQVTTKKNSRNS
jgi:four helix bundle protein